MKRINWLYIAIIPVVYLVFQINWNVANQSVFFYGFAENKETELNQNQAVLINQVFITPGQEVSKGQLLLEVSRSSLGLKIDDATQDVETIKLDINKQKGEIKGAINQLKAKRETKVIDLQTQIKTLEAKIKFNKSLLEDLQSVKLSKSKSNSADEIKLASLKEELVLVTEPIDVEIEFLQKQLASIQTPSSAKIQKLKNKITYFEKEQEKLSILAPSDGLIGNVHCKKGENVSSFNTLISFYERNPTLVKGYVHESLILEVNLGDSLFVASSLHPENQCMGKVIGMGTRIVEIPERLRKIPDFKTYGREVLIEIPSNNSFLQKEKVMLNSLDAETQSNYVVSFFNSFSKSNPTTDRKIKENFNQK